MLTFGFKKSNCPNKPAAIPPGAPAASCKDCAAFAILIIASPVTPGIFIGPFPRHQILDLTLAVLGATHFIASWIPSNPSALPLISLIKSKPYKILPTPPRSGPNTSPIPFTTLLKIAPVNWSAIQGVKFVTLSNSDVSNDVTSGSIVFPTASITQGKFFCNLATGPIIAVWAAVPAFFAIAVFWVAANVRA